LLLFHFCGDKPDIYIKTWNVSAELNLRVSNSLCLRHVSSIPQETRPTSIFKKQGKRLATFINKEEIQSFPILQNVLEFLKDTIKLHFSYKTDGCFTIAHRHFLDRLMCSRISAPAVSLIYVFPWSESPLSVLSFISFLVGSQCSVAQERRGKPLAMAEMSAATPQPARPV
jgi:hypothetical protein